MTSTKTNATAPSVEPRATPVLRSPGSAKRLRDESQILPSPTRIKISGQYVFKTWYGSNPGCHVFNKNSTPIVISRIGMTRDVLGFRSSKPIADLHHMYYAEKRKIVQVTAI